jgi:hypothetical protein
MRDRGYGQMRSAYWPARSLQNEMLVNPMRSTLVMYFVPEVVARLGRPKS